MSDNQPQEGAAAASTAAGAAATAALAADYRSTFLDLFDKPLTAEQKEKVEQLRAKVEPIAATLPPAMLRQWQTLTNVFLGRHLVARKWDVAAAEKMILGAADFRRKYDLDRITLFPEPAVWVRGYDESELLKIRAELAGGAAAPLTAAEEAEVRRMREAVANVRVGISECYHKWDKEGRPVYIQNTGDALEKELVARAKSVTPPGSTPADVFADVHMRANEVCATLLQHTFAKQVVPGMAPPHSVTAIFDCEKLEMRHRVILELISKQNANDMNFNAESLHRVLIVNAPTAARALWAIFKVVLDDRTAAKVRLVSPAETKAELLKIIDADKLPATLGGTCTCSDRPGGCIPPPMALWPEYRATPLPHGPTREFIVANGKTVEHAYGLSAGDTATWMLFMADRTINFAVKFFATEGSAASSATGAAAAAVVVAEEAATGPPTPTTPAAPSAMPPTSPSQPVVVQEAGKTEGKNVISGKFEKAPSAGKLVFTFHNSAAIRDKNVVFSCVITSSGATATTANNDEAAAASAAAASAAPAQNAGGK